MLWHSDTEVRRKVEGVPEEGAEENIVRKPYEVI